MYILHIETSTSTCSVALSNGDSLVTYKDINEGMQHSALLAPAIDQMLKDQKLSPDQLSAVSVSSGPGSYTGLRVGSAMAKAMAYALEKPLISIPTLQALASAVFEQHPEAEYALPMIDARRKEVYAALYDKTMHEVWPVSSFILDETFFTKTLPSSGSIVTCGDGALKIGEMADLTDHLTVDEQIQCSARHLISLSKTHFENGIHQDPLHFVPFYLKPPNITKSKKMANP